MPGGPSYIVVHARMYAWNNVKPRNISIRRSLFQMKLIEITWNMLSNAIAEAVAPVPPPVSVIVMAGVA